MTQRLTPSRRNPYVFQVNSKVDVEAVYQQLAKAGRNPYVFQVNSKPCRKSFLSSLTIKS